MSKRCKMIGLRPPLLFLPRTHQGFDIVRDQMRSVQIPFFILFLGFSFYRFRFPCIIFILFYSILFIIPQMSNQYNSHYLKAPNQQILLTTYNSFNVNLKDQLWNTFNLSVFYMPFFTP